MKAKTMLMVMLVMIAATCISSASTVLVDESFDSVADVSYTLKTTDTVTGTDAGNWIYDLRSGAGEGGFSGGKAVLTDMATDTGVNARYILFHTLSTPVSAASVTNVEITAVITPDATATQNFAVGIQADSEDLSETRYQIQINMKDQSGKYLMVFGAGSGQNGAGPETQKVAHTYRLTGLFTPKGDGTTDCNYTLVDQTDGSQNLSGTVNVAGEVLGTETFSKVQLFFNGKSVGTIDDVLVVMNVGTAVDDWILFD